MASQFPFDNLDFTPSHGTVSIPAKDGTTFIIPVSTGQGRIMEQKGIRIDWVYATVPATAVDAGFGGLWVWLDRLFRWPSRWGKK